MSNLRLHLTLIYFLISIIFKENKAIQFPFSHISESLLHLAFIKQTQSKRSGSFIWNLPRQMIHLNIMFMGIWSTGNVFLHPEDKHVILLQRERLPKSCSSCQTHPFIVSRNISSTFSDQFKNPQTSRGKPAQKMIPHEVQTKCSLTRSFLTLYSNKVQKWCEIIHPSSSSYRPGLCPELHRNLLILCLMQSRQ